MCGTESFEDVMRFTTSLQLDALALQELPDTWKEEIKGKWQIRVAEQKVGIRRCGLLINTETLDVQRWTSSGHFVCAMCLLKGADRRRELRIVSLHFPHSPLEDELWQERIMEVSDEMLHHSTILAGDFKQELHISENDSLVEFGYREDRPTTARAEVLRAMVANQDLAFSSTRAPDTEEDIDERKECWTHRNFASGRLSRLDFVCGPEAWRVHRRAVLHDLDSRSDFVQVFVEFFMEGSENRRPVYTPDCVLKDWEPADRTAYAYTISSRKYHTMDDLIGETYRAAKSFAKPRTTFNREEMKEEQDLLERRRTLRSDHAGRREGSKKLHAMRRDRRKRQATRLIRSSIARGALRQGKEKTRCGRQAPRQFEGSKVQGEWGGLLKSKVQEVFCAEGPEVQASPRIQTYTMSQDTDSWSPLEVEELVFVVKQELSRMKPGKCAGSDGLTAEAMHCWSDDTLRLLSTFFGSSCRTEPPHGLKLGARFAVS